MAARWGYFEDTVRLAAALRPALAARGVPARIYTDNGSAFVDAALNRAAARLGIKITHSAPGRPEGRGKIERFFRTVREEFLVEIGDGSGVADLAELNRLFTAWCERVYHARPHSETGQPPIQRWLAGAPFPVPDPAQLREAFLWSEHRIVRKDATLSLFGRPLPGQRPVPGRPEGRVRLRPVRHVGAGGPLERAAARHRGAAGGRPSLPPEGEARAAGCPAARRPGSTTSASSGPSTRKPPAGTGSAMTPSPPAKTTRTRTRRRAAGDRRPGRAGQRRARLGRPALSADPAAGAAETAAYLTAKAAVLERIAAERAAGGWSPEDTEAARDAAARAREAADTAALAAAAGITTLED